MPSYTACELQKGCCKFCRGIAAAVHTMAELKLSGNHLKGSRPVLSFDQARPPPPLQILTPVCQGRQPSPHKG